MNASTDPSSAIPPLPWTDHLPPAADVAVIGGGFSGLMTLVHLVRHAPRARVVLLERRPARTPGVAYGACDPVHLLNVPAGRMGCTTENPGEFLAWLEAHAPGQFTAGSFAPRRLYGRYLMEQVHRRLQEAWDRVTLVRDAVVHLDRTVDGFELLTASGRICAAGCVVLAPGIPPARAPWAETLTAQVPRQLLVADPWEAHALQGVAADAPVAVVGSGLTAIDVVLGLRARGHHGLVTMISRNGRLPLPHGTSGDAPHEFTAAQLAGGPVRVLDAVRRAVRERAARGQGWQPVLDALRPYTTEIWRTWSTRQRASFLRHARPMWEIHRHRAPRPVLDDLVQQMGAGTLHLVQGVLTRITADGGTDRVRVEYAPGPRTGASSSVAVSVSRVYNCIGPATSIRHTADPLLRSLMSAGLATPDPAGLGLLTEPDGRLHAPDPRGRGALWEPTMGAGGVPGDAAGNISEVGPLLFLVGALRRADAWESTAVPELRVQCEQVAQMVARQLAVAHAGGKR